MSRGLLVLAVCVGVLGLGGCGGGDSDSASTAANTTPDTVSATPQPSKQSAQVEPREQKKGKQDKSPAEKAQGRGSKQSNSSPKHLKLVKVPPISSAPKAGSKHPAPGVKTVKGGDNSVQEYGVEADESARTEAAIALQGYLNARAEEDWSSACSLLAQRPKEQLEKFAGSGGAQGKGLEGCAATMALLKEAQAQAIEQAQITEVLSLRGEGDISGDPSYLIFTGPPGNTLFSMPMYFEGAWKVGLARPSELPVG